MKTDRRLKSIAQLAGEAREWIKPRVVPTPLQTVPRELVAAGPDRLLLKLENQQVSGSFKARGAAHFIARLVAEHDPAGVLTYSSGNHGRAVSEVAAAMGIAALVVAPDSIDPVKAGAIIEAGAQLVQVGPTTDERKLRAEQIAAERGWVIVPPFDHEWIISGQGTLVLELIEQLGSAPDHLWLPVGGADFRPAVPPRQRSRCRNARFTPSNRRARRRWRDRSRAIKGSIWKKLDRRRTDYCR